MPSCLTISGHSPHGYLLLPQSKHQQDQIVHTHVGASMCAQQGQFHKESECTLACRADPAYPTIPPNIVTLFPNPGPILGTLTLVSPTPYQSALFSNAWVNVV